MAARSVRVGARAADASGIATASKANVPVTTIRIARELIANLS
jgi:hypothetical protein